MLHRHKGDLAEPDLFRLTGGRIARIRPLRSEDARLYPDFDARLTDEDRRLRFFTPAHMSAGQIKRLTEFDRGSALAEVAIDVADGRMLGVSRLHRFAPGAGEFAVAVRSDVKGQELGRHLLHRVIDRADDIGVDSIEGIILQENAGMLALARDLGFAIGPHDSDPALLRARLRLKGAPAPDAGMERRSASVGADRAPGASQQPDAHPAIAPPSTR